jgi:hypothetical protein
MDSAGQINKNRSLTMGIYPAIAAYFDSLGTLHGATISLATFLGISFVIAGAFVRTMVRLRTFAVVSSACLLLAAVMAPNPVSVLQLLVLLPLNAFRLVEIRRLTAKVTAATGDGDTSGLWLKPYMKAKRYPAGTFIFRKGDDADALYLLVEGIVEYPEISKQQNAGELFGEVSFFAPDHRRTLSAKCVTACLVMDIAGATFRQLYFENPKFAFTVANLLGQRMSADLSRATQRIAELESRLMEAAKAE